MIRVWFKESAFGLARLFFHARTSRIARDNATRPSPCKPQFFRLDSHCPDCVILWAHVRTLHGGERFWRADQTGRHRQGAEAIFCAALQPRHPAVKTHWHKLFLPLLRWLALVTGGGPSRLGRPVVFSILCGFGLAATSVCLAGTNSAPSAPHYEIRTEHDPNGIGKFTWDARLPV